jgi:hypothetical protein
MLYDVEELGEILPSVTKIQSKTHLQWKYAACKTHHANRRIAFFLIDRQTDLSLYNTIQLTCN